MVKFLQGLVVTCILAAICCGYAHSQEVIENRIVVYGKAEVTIPANQARVTFTVKGTGPSLREALDDAKGRTAGTAKQLFNLGVKATELTTSHFHTGANLGDKAIFSSKRDYRALITVLVSLDNLDLLEPVLLAIGESQPEYLSGISYSLKDDSLFQNQAREVAITRAKEKAKAVAAQSGVVLGKIVSVEEIPAYGPADYLRARAAAYLTSGAVAYKETGPSIFPQNISVCAEVRLTYELAK